MPKSESNNPIKRRRIPIPDLIDSEIVEFWNSVDVGEPDECWEWNAGQSNGYGHFSIKRDGRYISLNAIRVAWKIHTGNDPGELVMRHLVCRNPPCVSPYHLLPGTYKENSEDAIRDGTTAKGEQNGNSYFTEEQVVMMRRFYAAGWTLAKLSAFFHGRSSRRGHIYLIVSGKIWKHAGGPIATKGTRERRYKLTRPDVEDILKRSAEGESIHDIHLRYPWCSRGNIAAILDNRSWQSVPGPRIKANPRPRVTDEQKAQVLELARTMPILNTRSIGRQVGLNHITVAKILRKAGIEPLQYKGDIQHSAVTTPAMRNRIRWRVLKLGVSQHQVAREEDISRSAVRYSLNRSD